MLKWIRAFLAKSLDENKQKLRCQTCGSVKRRKRRSKFRRLQINLLVEVTSVPGEKILACAILLNQNRGDVGDIFCQWITLSPLLAWFPMLPHTDTYNQQRKIISTSHGLDCFWILKYFCCVCWNDNWSAICLHEAAVPVALSIQSRYLWVIR